MLSTLITIMAIAPIAGPLIGGQMIKVTSWHAILWLLAIMGTLMLVLIYWLPETLPTEKRVEASLSGAFKNYYKLLSNTTFTRFMLCVTFYSVAAYAFITGSPFVYITYFHVDAQQGKGSLKWAACYPGREVLLALH